ncbi:MAG TPA: prepilin-type N-terminal cleavage/methylation domain-containing protein [Pyrinomonadaceae bacterium]|nr:prepilin-type N-terminal cleavage/methylation domain-containing protein [Pyrinomonadaceae bacterium]
MSRSLKDGGGLSLNFNAARQRGFTLIELMMTLTILTILTLGVIPLVKLSVKRQREQRLREALREMRTAIEEFHRDTIGMQCQGGVAIQAAPTGPIPNPAQNPGGQPGGQPQQGQVQMVIDPRSKVVISDCTIFTVDNPDRYPPDLETLVNGVNIVPRAPQGGLGGAGLTGSSQTATTVGGQLSTKKKVYLRAIPVDPITGQADWCLRSSYESADSETCSEGENVFDVRSKSTETALNGEKYNEW